jgi:hypothetical protein
MGEVATQQLLNWGPAKKRPRRLNAAKHGCRAKELIVPGERRSDYDKLWEMWLAEYAPESEVDMELLRMLVHAAWRLRRSERALREVERALKKARGPAAEWTDDEIRRVQLMQRYKTTDENSYYKALRNIEFMKRSRDQELQKWEKEHPEAAKAKRKADEEQQNTKAPLTRAQGMFQGQNSPKKRKKYTRLEQWVEVRIEDGNTVTKLYPSNEDLIEEGKEMLPPPDLIYRRINFPDGVPPEYYWASSDEQFRKYGGWGIQRMRVDTCWTRSTRNASEGRACRAIDGAEFTAAGIERRKRMRESFEVLTLPGPV